MADKDRVYRLCSDESIGSSTKSSDQENHGSDSKTNAMQRDKYHQQETSKLNVFERNYQYARIYETRRSAMKAEKDAEVKSQCHFKASPMPIVESVQTVRQMPRFTVPNTPQVLKHSKRTPRT